MNKITKHKVATYFSGREIYSHLYDSKEKALSKVKVGSIHKYEGEVEIYLYCENCDKDLNVGDEYLKTDEETRYCSDCYEDGSFTYYTVGGDQVGDENDAETYDKDCPEVSEYMPHNDMIDKDEVLGLIDQLDEPEITEEQALNKLAESYPFSADGINAILQAQLAGYSPLSTMRFIQSKEPDSTVEYRKGYEQGVLNAIQTANESKLVEIPQFVADWIEFCKKNEASLAECLTAMNIDHQRAFNWLNSNRSDVEEIVARAWLNGYTIEPQKTLQVIVKNYDSTVFTTELPEDEAMKLIEGWSR